MGCFSWSSSKNKNLDKAYKVGSKAHSIDSDHASYGNQAETIPDPGAINLNNDSKSYIDSKDVQAKKAFEKQQ